MPPRLERVQPVLMSSDVPRSVRFYERLGFRKMFEDVPEAPRYAGIERDGVHLHLQWQDQSQWAHSIDRPTYRFLVPELDELYAEFGEIGALDETSPSPWALPGDTPWGTREFHVLDPDGNGLQFYRSIGLP